jgi:predicted ATPase/class 3 adenylate cyclase
MALLPTLPTGTVTFLFTDMVGSTNLARKYPDIWSAIQEHHHDLLRNAISAHHGYVFQVIGDEFQAAFATTLDALSAALDAQYALQTADWGEIGSMHVRMGLHTGPATPHVDKYEGYLTLSHTKRLMSIAHGDQILLSEATEALLDESLPEDITLRNLGKHRLKDFERGETIYQVIARDLPAEFPPLQSQVIPPNNLPVQLTSFVGRSRELTEIKQVLSTERLLTLTGPGGSGKTRLALQAAVEMIEHFHDGVFFVALAPITDMALVPLAIAQSLTLTETPGRSIVDSLKDYLTNKLLLLILDNFEQVISSSSLVAELLMVCKELKIIVTSRERLHIGGEHEYPVLPLDMPNPTQMPSLDSLSQYSAVELFLQRAKAVKPDIRITNDTARAIAEICYRLDGLPLAIELAAARIKVLSPRAMLDRMEHRLEFLTGGVRDLPKRQQTLRNTIAWSYDLLHEDEQRLFRRISVFVGGCTIEAVEAVTEDHPSQVSILDQLGSLLDKSLLQEVDGTNNEPRFVLLETLREFGWEQLEASGEQDTIRQRHASFYLVLAEQAEASLENVEQVQWMNQMEQEHDNLLAALEWSRTAEGAIAGAPNGGTEMCLRLAGAMGFFWEARGYYSEGRERLAAILLTKVAQGRTAARARLLARSAELAYRQSDFLATSNFARESLAIYREVGDSQGMASALIKLGNAEVELGNYGTAAEYLEEALKIWREREDRHGTARALISYGWVALRSGNYPLAKARLEEALTISRESGDTRRIGFELAGLGEVALRQGNYQHATQLVEESLELRRLLGNKWGIGVSLGILGWIAMRGENWARAKVLLGESLKVRQEIGDLSGIAWCIERLAAVAQARGQKKKAVHLFGFGAVLRATIRSVIDPSDKAAYESKIRILRSEFGKEGFAAMWEEGRALTLERAVDYALEG